jgi:hypothetical protein
MTRGIGGVVRWVLGDVALWATAKGVVRSS